MISSTLRPEVIIGNSPATLSSFGNFMTGRSLSEYSPLSNATNKIVNFNRQGITPLTPNISSLVSNISTNILNQVDNSIKNTTNFIQNNSELELTKLRNDLYSRITDLQVNLNDLQRDYQTSTREIQDRVIQKEGSKVDSRSSISGIQTVIQNIQVQVQNVLDNTLRSFSKDYQDKVKGFDDNRPSNVLSKFLDLYRNAIGFVNFFGDRKNINTVNQNLKSLRLMFEESFEVAKVLRQTIIKIVNQLSNLPTASPTSGGLNLDIAVPGGRLKQAGGPMVRNIGRVARIGGIAGAGLLGLGGLAAATSGMGRAKQYQEELLSGGVSTVSGEQYMSGNMVESFSAIVDRFVTAVNGLISGTKGSSNVGGGSGGGSVSSSSPPQPPNSMGLMSGNAEPEVKSLLDMIASPESGGNYEAMYPGTELKGASDMTIAEVAKKATGPVGRYQHKPQYLIARAIAVGLDPNVDKFNQENQDLITRGHISSLFTGGEQAVIEKLKNDPSIVKRQLEQSTYTGLQKYGSNFNQLFRERLNQYSSTSGQVINAKQKVDTMETVLPAMEQKEASQRIAKNISQPAQKAPQTITLPPNIIDAGVPQQQSSGGGVVPQAPSGSGSYEVPFLPTTNPDNFLTMYSRIVYNIVDG